MTIKGTGGNQYINHTYTVPSTYAGVDPGTEIGFYYVFITGSSADCLFTELNCSGNQLIALDLSANTKLTSLDCINNRLPLSDLFAASERMNLQDELWMIVLGTQNLLTQTVIIGEVVAYSDQNMFNGIYTQFAIAKNGSIASQSNYTLNNGKITFNSPGNYTVTMTNAAIVSYENFPAIVIAAIKVTEATAPEVTTSTLPDGAIGTSYDQNLTATGVQLYSIVKDAGMIEIPFQQPNGSIFVIKGSSGGTVKVIKN